MDKKISSIIFSGIVFTSPLSAEFYVKAGTGISVPLKTTIHAPSAEWDPSPQGYDGYLGSKFLLSAGIGYDFPWMFSVEATASYRFNYRYRKFQTSTIINTPGFLGDKVRRFDLDIGTFMVNAYFSGRGVSCLNWNFGCFPINIYPFIGFGIGGNQHILYNFRSVGLSAVTESCNGFDPSLNLSFGSENPYTERFNFAFQAFLGLEAKFWDTWALSFGYRYFDAGTFKGPQYIRNQCGIASDIGRNVWKIDVSANEFFLEIKTFL